VSELVRSSPTVACRGCGRIVDTAVAHIYMGASELFSCPSCSHQEVWRQGNREVHRRTAVPRPWPGPPRSGLARCRAVGRSRLASWDGRVGTRRPRSTPATLSPRVTGRCAPSISKRRWQASGARARP